MLGMLFHKEIPRRIEKIIVQAIGLATCAIGISMIVKLSDVIALVLGLLIGAIFGELMRLEERLNEFAGMVKSKFSHDDDCFIEGMVTAFITFCIGPMTIVGSIEDGLGNPSILFAKSVLDGFMAIAYSASLGVGVIFSTIPMLLYQGSIALIASMIKITISTSTLNTLTATGGSILLGLGIKLLKIKDLKITNLLPALVIAPLITTFK